MGFFRKKARMWAKNTGNRESQNTKEKKVSTRGSAKKLSIIDKQYGEKFLKVSVFKNVREETTPIGLKIRAQISFFVIIVAVVLGFGLGFGIKPKHDEPGPGPLPPSPPNHYKEARAAAQKFVTYVAEKQSKYFNTDIKELLVFKSKNFVTIATSSQESMPAFLPVHSLKFNKNQPINIVNAGDNYNYWTDLAGTDFTGFSYKFGISINLQKVTPGSPTDGILFCANKCGANKTNCDLKLVVNSEEANNVQNSKETKLNWQNNEVVRSAIDFTNTFDTSSGIYNSYLQHFPAFYDGDSKKLVHFSTGPMTGFIFNRNFINGQTDGEPHTKSTLDFFSQEFEYKNFNFSGVGVPDFPKKASGSSLSNLHSASVVSLMNADQMYTFEKSYNNDPILSKQYKYMDSTGISENKAPGLFVADTWCKGNLYDEGNTSSLYYYNLALHQSNYSLINSRISNSLPSTSVNVLNFTGGHSILSDPLSVDNQLSSQYISVAPKNYYNLPVGHDNAGTRSFYIQHDPSTIYSYFKYSAMLAPFVLQLHYLWVPQNGNWQSSDTKWALAVVYDYTPKIGSASPNYNISANFTSTVDSSIQIDCKKAHKIQEASYLAGYNHLANNQKGIDYNAYKQLGFADSISTDLQVHDDASNQKVMQLGPLSSTTSTQIYYRSVSF